MAISRTAFGRTSGARVALVGAGLGLAAAGLAFIAPAHAAATTCEGQAVTIVATADNQDVTGTDGPDVISTNGFAFVDVFAGGGDDIVCTRTGDPPGLTHQGEVHGEAGNDTLISSSPDRSDLAELYGEGGDDVLEVESGSAVLRPGPGDDTMHASADPVLIDGDPAVSVHFTVARAAVQVDVPAGTVDGQGHDSFTGLMGFDGTKESDVFKGGPGRDFYIDGASVEARHPGSDSVKGGSGDDDLFVLRGDIDGGSGDDSLAGGHGAVHGGSGRDAISVVEGGHASGGPGADVITTEINVEQFVGLTTRTFVLNGGTGPDRIFVTSPEDESGFQPCPRSKVCSFRANGGPGSDVLSFHRTGGKVRLDLARGRATYVGGHTTNRHVENVEGSISADILRGTRRADHLDGQGGPDRLFGRAGPDVLLGGPGRDIAEGGPGLDRCLAEVRRSCH